MADAQLQIIIKARNEAKKEFDSLNKQVNQLQGAKGFGGLNSKVSAFGDKFKSVTGVSLGFASAAGLAGAAVSGVAKFLTEAVNETVAYATEVDNMSRLLGINTEETSRLIQASDDLFISQETLKSGLQAATRQGIDVSIEGLKELSEQYLALPEGVERSSFVLKTFGRSGAEMGKLMEQGAAGIETATAAIADNMVITERSMSGIMNYKRSVDNLTDAWQGFKYQVGTAVIPQLDLLLRQMTKGKDEVEAYYENINTLNERLVQLKKYGGMAGLSQAELAIQIADVEGALDDAYGALDNYVAEVAAAAAEQATLNERLNDLKTIMAGGIGKEVEDFNLKVRDLKIEQGGVVDRIKELEGLSYLTPEQKQELDDLRQRHADISLAIQDMQAAHETAMKTMAMNMIIAKASSDGLTENEVSNIGAIMVAWGLWDEETARVIDNINGIDLNDANLEINGLKENILGIPDRTATITVQTRYEGDFTGAGWTIGKMEMNLGEDINGNGIVGQAIGGPVQAGQPYVVGETGRELFIPDQPGTIIPNNQLQGGAASGGGTVINFTYAPAVSLSDRVEMETKLIPLMRRLMARV